MRRADGHRGSVGRGPIGYSLAMLLGSAAVIGIAGGTAWRIGGILSAWAVQSLAFWRLSEALQARRDARTIWVGGITARGLGLVVCGGMALAGRASDDLPVAYGITMLVLLLAEVVWLARTAPQWVDVSTKLGAKNELDRTHSTG